MKKILAFGASNSIHSINKKLAVYAVNCLEDVIIDLIDLNDFEMPVYGVDKELNAGIPALARAFLAKIKDADGIIISFAEHNGAYTTAFKNIFDWVSRIEGGLWSGKPMLAMATSPGKRGGSKVLEIATDRFRFMGGNIVATFSLPSFHENFDPQKGILDEDLKKEFELSLLAFKTALELH
jgi:NAD(P)H-dependent FMN reductase